MVLALICKHFQGKFGQGNGKISEELGQRTMEMKYLFVFRWRDSSESWTAASKLLQNLLGFFAYHLFKSGLKRSILSWIILENESENYSSLPEDVAHLNPYLVLQNFHSFLLDVLAGSYDLERSILSRVVLFPVTVLKKWYKTFISDLSVNQYLLSLQIIEIFGSATQENITANLISRLVLLEFFDDELEVLLDHLLAHVHHKRRNVFFAELVNGLQNMLFSKILNPWASEYVLQTEISYFRFLTIFFAKFVQLKTFVKYIHLIEKIYFKAEKKLIWRVYIKSILLELS